MKRRKLCALVLAAALSGLTACSGGEKEEGTQTKKQEPVMTALENGEVSLQKSRWWGTVRRETTSMAATRLCWWTAIRYICIPDMTCPRTVK